MDLLVLKERVKVIYQKYGYIIEPVAKLISAFIVFSIINATIGYDTRLNNILVVLLLSVVSAFTPASFLILLATLYSIGHIFFISKILAVLTILIMFILYFLLIRFTRKQGFVVLLLPILFILKVPYIVPIMLGLFSTPMSIIPMGCGVIVYYLFTVIKLASEIPSTSNVDDILQLYKYVIDELINNKQMFYTMIVFAVVIITTYIIRRLKINRSFDLAILAGTVINMITFLIIFLRLKVSESIVIMILGVIASACIVYVIRFFRLNLDYTRVENVQFEDDDYYYYVKAVPKINVTKPDVNVKRINPRKSNNIVIKDDNIE